MANPIGDSDEFTMNTPRILVAFRRGCEAITDRHAK